MTDEANRCPDPEVLAAFVAGNLSGAELKMTADHLRECEDCRIVVGDTARVTRGRAQPVVETSMRQWPWWLAAAAAALAGVVYLSWWSGARYASREIRILVAATPRGGRYVEPRLSGGFPWAPLRPARRESAEALDAGQMKLVGAAGEVLEKTAGDRSIEGQHAAALAHLLAGRPKEAAELLAMVAPRASDPRIWTDLAAARFAAAVQREEPAQLAQALAAVDAALRVDPRSPEALFDRALVLEHLGLRDQALASWRQYLAVDSGSSWATEARQHVRALSAHASFRDELEREYARLVRDPAAARVLAATFPEESRLWGETEILGRWAQAHKAHDTAAGMHLRLVKAFGDELARSHGEQMLRGAVAAIEMADEQRQSALAEAHLQFRTAQKTYQAGRLADAERMFTNAATAFQEGRSPLALVAHYFVANTAFDQGRIAEAETRLDELVTAAPAELPAHRAQVEWELGLAHATLGRWGDAMRVLSDSVATFERLGENKNATAVREILAEVYDRIGEPAAAWHHRIVALHELGKSQTPRLQVAIESVVRAAALNRDWPVALSFLGLELEIIQRDGDDMAYVETILLRARVEGRMARPRDAAVDLARATKAMSRLHDKALRDRAEADRMAVAGCLASSPKDAVALLTRAIDFHRVNGRRIFIPEMLLERGRALKAMGSAVAAADDFEHAICEIEAQRTSIDAGDQRWGVFMAADELFDDALALAISRGDMRGALAYAERSRARELLDAMNIAPSPSSLAATYGDAVVIEYASLPAGLVIFVIDKGRVRAVQQDVVRSALAEAAEHLARSAMKDDREEFKRLAFALYARLVGPVADSIDGTRLLVFVPDATLSRVPFAALLDPKGRYLIEQHPVIVAPSAAVYARLSSQTKPRATEPRVLVITGPAARDGEFRHLSAAGREADAVAAAYRDAVMLGPKDGDQGALVDRAAAVDVIHFVGHAIEADESIDAALVAPPRAGGMSRLNVRDIASMRLSHVGVVVLAACSTARGRAGQDGISLARAFVAAGVPSVVATLWSIEDSPAAEFFPHLHRLLAARVPPAEALRSTQLEWIHRRDVPPGMWAAVEIIGS